MCGAPGHRCIESQYRFISLWGLMKRIAPSLFLSLGKLLEVSSFKIRPPFKGQVVPGHELIDQELKDSHAKVLANWEEECRDLELAASLATIKRVQALLSQPNCEYREYAELCQELHGRIEDEMKYRSCWALTLKEGEIYRSWSKGWEHILVRFPDTRNDIEEAQKCFALARYPASVFHSIQVIEVGLIDLGTFIGVADPKSGWTAVANELKKIVSKRHAELTDLEKQHFQFLEQIQGTVEALKNAWRNKVSHVQGKIVLMTREFNPEVAEEILLATRAFMRGLDSGLPITEEYVASLAKRVSEL
jgi:Skp family chaperone for outer membrane proteins